MLRGFRLELGNNRGPQETRMMELRKKSEISLATWIQYTNMTDGQTDRQTDGQTLADSEDCT